MAETSLQAQAEVIVTTLPRIMRRLFALYPGDPRMELSVAQLRVCALLRDGAKTMSAISRELGISLSATTQIADRLEVAGMAERLPEADDRRIRMLQLTSQGEEAMRTRDERRVERVLSALQEMSATDRQALASALHLFLEASHKIALSLPKMRQLRNWYRSDENGFPLP